MCPHMELQLQGQVQVSYRESPKNGDGLERKAEKDSREELRDLGSSPKD